MVGQLCGMDPSRQFIRDTIYVCENGFWRVERDEHANFKGWNKVDFNAHHHVYTFADSQGKRHLYLKHEVDLIRYLNPEVPSIPINAVISPHFLP